MVCPSNLFGTIFHNVMVNSDWLCNKPLWWHFVVQKRGLPSHFSQNIRFIIGCTKKKREDMGKCLKERTSSFTLSSSHFTSLNSGQFNHLSQTTILFHIWRIASKNFRYYMVELSKSIFRSIPNIPIKLLLSLQ